LCGGNVHLPGDPGFDDARRAWNLVVDQHPAAVAVPRDAADVTAVVQAAAAAGLRVAPQSTGHNAGPLAARGLDDVVLVRMSSMAAVSLDPSTRIARVEGGALWDTAVAAAGEAGLAALHGSSPDVGIAGYTLGGGIGWYSRKLGLAANSLTAVEVVIADGTLVRADRDTEPDLFWALRGGGGSFGVVTAMEFALHPVDSVYAGMMLWDVASAEQVLRTWAAWAPGAPDEVTTAFRILNLPPLPELPEFLRGRSVAVVDGAVLGSDQQGRELLGELRGVQPELDTFAQVPPPVLARLHMDPEGGAPGVSDTALLDALPDGAVDSMLAAVGPESGSSLMVAELRQLGGALGREHPGGGSLSRLDASFLAFGVTMAPTPELSRQGLADAQRFTSALAPWSTERRYLNFTENAVDPSTGYSEDGWQRLAGVRAAVDPTGIFAANHQVPRLSEIV
jgi:FAD/FMN-containing dehydrogenase